jgi:hypothetical protein
MTNWKNNGRRLKKLCRPGLKNNKKRGENPGFMAG